MGIGAAASVAGTISNIGHGKKQQKHQQAIYDKQMELANLRADALEGDAGTLLENAAEKAEDYRRAGRWRTADMERRRGYQLGDIGRQADRGILAAEMQAGEAITDLRRRTGREVFDTGLARDRQLGAISRRTGMEEGSAALRYAQSGVGMGGTAQARLAQIRGEGALAADRMSQDAQRRIDRLRSDEELYSRRIGAHRDIRVGQIEEDRGIMSERVNTETDIGIERNQFISETSAQRVERYAQQEYDRYMDADTGYVALTRAGASIQPPAPNMWGNLFGGLAQSMNALVGFAHSMQMFQQPQSSGAQWSGMVPGVPNSYSGQYSMAY